MELNFDGMSSDEEDLPKITFGSFSQSQTCKREPGGTTITTTGGEQSQRRSPPTDPRLTSNRSQNLNRRQGYRPQANGDRNAAGNGNRGTAGGGPIRHRGKRSRSVRAAAGLGNSVFNVKFEIRSKTVKNFLGSADAAGNETDEDGDEQQAEAEHMENGGSVSD